MRFFENYQFFGRTFVDEIMAGASHVLFSYVWDAFSHSFGFAIHHIRDIYMVRRYDFQSQFYYTQYLTRISGKYIVSGTLITFLLVAVSTSRSRGNHG